MNIVETIAPIAIEDLKKYFEDKETFYVIDYEKSVLKGKQLLTYLGNLDIPCDVKDFDDEFVESYLHFDTIVNLPSLEELTISYLMMLKMDEEVPHRDILLNWEKRIDSLTLYNSYTVDHEQNIHKDYVKTFPEDDTDSRVGINFISLLKHELFYTLFCTVKEENLTYYSKYFNDYMFKGKNLYHYWAIEQNPLFINTWAKTLDEETLKGFLDDSPIQ
jgi:hypothetical protein